MSIGVKSTFGKTVFLAVFCLAFAAVAAAADGVSEDAARQAALGQLPGARVVKMESVRRGGGDIRYNYMLVTDDARAKVTIDGRDGSLIRFVKSPIESNNLPRRMRGDGLRETEIAAEEARQIALKRVGGGEVVKIEKDYDDGVIVYEIEIIDEDLEYEIDVDADTGEILKYKAESHDDDYGKRSRKSWKRRD